MPKPPVRQAPEARLAAADLLDTTEVTQPWPGTEVEVDLPGGRVRVNIRTTPATADDAEPALFVHGLGGSGLNWTDLAGRLRHRLSVEAIDLPGHGASGPMPGRRYTPQRHAETVIAYIEQSGRGPAHLVGNSMGGAISILVASARPDLVRTLTLVSPAVPDNRLRIYPLRYNPRFALIVVPVLGEALAKQFAKRYAPEVRAKGTIALCFGDRRRVSETRLAEMVEELRQRADVPWAESALLRSLRGLATSQLLRGRNGWRTMRRITAPSLVVWGDKDRLVAPDLAPYVAGAIPDARLLVIEGVGHVAMIEEPDTVARAMLAMVDEAGDVNRGTRSDAARS